MRVPLQERGARANESLEIIRGLFANERFSYAGRHFTIDDVSIAPRPLQPKLPVWVGGTSEAALRRAARYGDGWIAAFSSERKFARLAAAIREFLAAEGRAAEPFTLGALVFANTGPDVGRSRAAGADYISRVYNLAGDSIMQRFAVAGPPEACAERLRSYIDAGAQEIVLGLVCGYREWPRQLEACGEIIAMLGAN